MSRRVARTHGAPRGIAIWALLILLVAASALFGQKKKDQQGNTRSVQGEVTAQDDSPVAGAVVQLKNTKTLQIRSFITKDNGSYYFNGLSPDVDYELRADSQGLSSPTKTLSSFDSRKAATINLKLNKK
jgi:hypothetical protein